MKKISTIILTVLISCFIFTSCEKSATEPGSSQIPGNESTANPFLTPENRQALINTLQGYINQNAGAREVEFLPAFFTSTAFGIFDDDFIKLATFSTELDNNDFFRENPDGTVSVHIASNNAFSEVYDYSTGDYSFGDKGHMVMNYSGPVIEIPVFDEYGNIIAILKFVVPDENSPATVWHGNGKVRLNGTGPKKNLVAHLTASAGWGNVNTFVHLN